MKILTLLLENFQNAQNEKFVFDEKNVSIYGANGSGKTTIANAIAWLLFDRAHSADISGFSPKPLEGAGREIHNLTTAVEARISDEDGAESTLRKEQTEKWTKKRGRTESEFSGHTVAYFWDGVPILLSEFNIRLEAMLGTPEQIKVLSNPRYFSVSMPWKKRREMLFALFGSVDDATLLNHGDWQEIREILMKPGSQSGDLYTVDEYRKKAEAARKKVNDRLDILPELINENARQRGDTASGMDIATVTAKIAELETKRTTINNDIAIRNVADPRQTEARERLAAKRTEYEEAKAAHIDAQSLVRSELNQQIEKLSAQKYELTRTAQRMDMEADDAERRAGRMTAQRQALGTAYNAEKASSFDPQATVCDKCNQTLPADQIATLQENFNVQKANKLEQIRSQCEKECSKDMIAEAQAQAATARQAAAEARTSETALLNQIDGLRQELAKLEPFEGSEAERRIRSELTSLRCDDAQATAESTSNAVLTLRQELETVNNAIQTLHGQKASIEQAERITLRAKELDEEQRNLAAELDSLEHGLQLCERFVRAKCALVTERINAHFSSVRFRLFNDLINGGMEECCDVLVHTAEGYMPFGGGANTAAEVNAGLEIIGVLSNALEWSVPVVIDGAESVTSIIPIAPQVIRLVVSMEHPALCVKTDSYSLQMPCA